MSLGHLLLLVVFNLSMDRTLIVTIADKRPDFLQLQLESFDMFLSDYDFLVLNNNFKRKGRKEIKRICTRLSLRSLRVKRKFRLSRIHNDRAFKRWYNEYRTVNLACSYAMNFFWTQILPDENYRWIIFIDSDMFMTSKFDVPSFMKESDIAFVPQFRGPGLEVSYPWNGIVVIDTKTQPNYLKIDWHPGSVLGHRVDVGGQSHWWLSENKLKSRIKPIMAFAIYDISITDEGRTTSVQIAINGNWNAIANIRNGEVVWDFSKFLPTDSTVLKLDAIDSVMEWRDIDLGRIGEIMKDILNQIVGFDFPAPVYFDMIGIYENDEFNPLIFHYKSGSNYQPWATPTYNFSKTLALRSYLHKNRL